MIRHRAKLTELGERHWQGRYRRLKHALFRAWHVSGRASQAKMSNKGWMGKASICRSLYRARVPEVPLTVGPRPLPGPNPSPGFLSPPPKGVHLFPRSNSSSGFPEAVPKSPFGR
jgi:hypothetical protein